MPIYLIELYGFDHTGKRSILECKESQTYATAIRILAQLIIEHSDRGLEAGFITLQKTQQTVSYLPLSIEEVNRSLKK